MIINHDNEDNTGSATVSFSAFAAVLLHSGSSRVKMALSCFQNLVTSLLIMTMISMIMMLMMLTSMMMSKWQIAVLT